MTDVLIDDDVIELNRTTTNPSARRTMFIETEMRTETVTKRRAGSTTSSGRSVYDILQNTRSPTDGLPPTTYTYAHSVSYMPVTENGTYSVPVMARRDLHGEYRSYGSSSFSSTSSVFASPIRFVSNVRSQLVNGYSAIRNRLMHQNNLQQGETEQILASPTTQRGTRFSRSSSQSSTNAQTTGYNLRRRPPVHSTPRDPDSEQVHQRKVTKRTSHDGQDDEEIQELNEVKGENVQVECHMNKFFCCAKAIVCAPFKTFIYCSQKMSLLPLWLLLLLLVVLGLYILPQIGCRLVEPHPHLPIAQYCRTYRKFTNKYTQNLYSFIPDSRKFQVGGYARKISDSIIKTKTSLVNFFGGIYYKMKNSSTTCCVETWNKFKKFTMNIFTVTYEAIQNVLSALWGVFGRIAGSFNNAFKTTKENAKEYCDASLEKINSLFEELKREKEKLLSSIRQTSKSTDESEYEAIVRQLLEEYAADETGLADYALEANGGKIVDTRCTEYTDEPRQNVVKFLGIPIVHMSKQPDIMIKAGRMPGQCFPFKGDQGSVIIKLAVPVKPTEFVLEHLSKRISVVGHINSAPKDFTVYALKDKNDREGVVLGRYKYDAENGSSLQRFKPQLVNIPLVEYVELRVTSNWGNPNYTCVYRFRVHGDLPTASPAA